MMPLLRCRVPKIARHAALGHMNDYDLENQSCGPDGLSCRRSTTALTGTGVSEASLLNTPCNVLSVPTTIWPWICVSELMRSAHCRSMRRWTLNGYMALINLADTLLRENKSSRDLRSLGERSRGDLEGSMRSGQIAPQLRER